MVEFPIRRSSAMLVVLVHEDRGVRTGDEGRRGEGVNNRRRDMSLLWILLVVIVILLLFGAFSRGRW